MIRRQPIRSARLPAPRRTLPQAMRRAPRSVTLAEPTGTLVAHWEAMQMAMVATSAQRR